MCKVKIIEDSDITLAYSLTDNYMKNYMKHTKRRFDTDLQYELEYNYQLDRILNKILIDKEAKKDTVMQLRFCF
jgi:hypothetical protein